MTRFLHAADLHLDSPLRGLAHYEGAPIERIRSASREAFQKLVNYAIDEKVDFVVLAGDIFDGSWKDANCGLWLLKRFAELDRAGISVYVLKGNHDAESKVASRQLPWPKNVFEFASKKPETFLLEEHGVALHGQSFAKRDVTDNLAEAYPAPVEGAFNLGVLHTALSGEADDHKPYAPCSLNDLKAKGYDYWALGHVHQRKVICEDPWVLYPGNIQGRHIREAGPKGATLVELNDGRVQSVQDLEFDVLRWSEIQIDLEGIDDREDFRDRARTAFQDEVGKADGRLLALRVNLTGATELHAEFLRDPSALRHDLVATTLLVDDLWLEKHRVKTSERRRDTGALRELNAEDGFVELADQVDQLELDEDAVKSLRQDGALKKLAKALADVLPERGEEFLSSDAVGTAAREAQARLSMLLRERAEGADT